MVPLIEPPVMPLAVAVSAGTVVWPKAKAGAGNNPNTSEAVSVAIIAMAALRQCRILKKDTDFPQDQEWIAVAVTTNRANASALPRQKWNPDLTSAKDLSRVQHHRLERSPAGACVEE